MINRKRRMQTSRSFQTTLLITLSIITMINVQYHILFALHWIINKCSRHFVRFTAQIKRKCTSPSGMTSGLLRDNWLNIFRKFQINISKQNKTMATTVHFIPVLSSLWGGRGAAVKTMGLQCSTKVGRSPCQICLFWWS